MPKSKLKELSFMPLEMRVRVCATAHAVVRQPSGLSQGLVTAKARLAKQGLTIPLLELVSAHMSTNLITNVEKALEGFPVNVAMNGWIAQWLSIE